MKVQYNEHRDEFSMTLSRSEAIDMSVFLGMRGNRGWLALNGLDGLSDELHRALRGNPPLDACEHCITAITYVEGEWRHSETCRAYCADGNHKAAPRREGQ